MTNAGDKQTGSETTQVHVTPSSSSDLSNVAHNIISELTFLTGALFLLIVIYIRKKILNIVLTESENDFKRGKDLYLSVIQILNFSHSDRVLIYEFDDKHKLLKSPVIQVKSAGINEYTKGYDIEENDIEQLLFNLKNSKDNTIKSVVAEIDNDYVRAELMSNGVNYIINKLLIFDGDSIGLLILHYCKNGKGYFDTLDLSNTEINIILLMNSLTRKEKTFFNKLFSLFK